jgi:glycosyltransferase involved in cell wall biosynthesis
MRVAIAHDYLTQRGGAERVVLAMARAFPSAPVYTSLYNPATTFTEFRELDVRPMWLNRLPPLRARHRLALPLLAPAFGHELVDADVVLCSSSGWAHGIHCTGRKVVYCHTPARWLYDGDRYLGGKHGPAWAALSLTRPYLLHWDRRSALGADRYVANSTVVRDRVRAVYGIDAPVIPAPPGMLPGAAQEPVPRLEPRFFLCVARLLPYKNLDAVLQAFASLPGHSAVVVGTGPLAAPLRAMAPRNVRFLGAVSDEQLRWLYAHCTALVAASHEDYGLTPLEAALFGKPAVVLRQGGFIDTVEEGTTGIFFDRPVPRLIRAAVRVAAGHAWDEEALRAHAERFSEARFAARLRRVVELEAAA